MEELESLVHRARLGELDAFGTIVRRFQDMVVGYAYSITGDFHLAEDAVQEAFIWAYLNLSELREPAVFPDWFRRIVFTRCGRLTRGKRIATVPLEEAYHLSAVAPDPFVALEMREMNDMVHGAIGTLPEHEHKVTTLFYISDYSQKEIAAFLEIPVTAVKKRLHDARKRLKERMMVMV